MRILSWNINGVRTLPQYHPWNTLGSFRSVLGRLDADVVCFQEIKSSRTALDSDIAVPDPFHAFFSFPANMGGYSGVAVYTDSTTVTPLKAEEGLSGSVQPRPPLSTDERISRSYPSALEMPDLIPHNSDLAALDAEGRALVLDFGLFVLINVYCPNETSDARLPFKMNYHFMLQERVHKLIAEGRQVIVVGDINVCATPLDHCDGHLASNAAAFHDHPARAWFNSWLSPNGPMSDVVRSFWPNRKGMYTCWNSKLQARETNYGTRVDYILVTRGMLPWIKHGDIQPSFKGSDHCPIFIDLHDEITTSSGQTLSLRQVMPMHGDRTEPPRLAARRWDEFSGKQTLLSAFFAKGPSASDSQPPGSPSPCSSHASAILSTHATTPRAVPPPDLVHVQVPDSSTAFESLPFLATTTATGPTPSERGGDLETKKRAAPLKRNSTDPPAAVASKPTKKQKKKDKGKQPGSLVGSGSSQRTLAAFFAPQFSQLPPRTRSSPSASQKEWNAPEHPSLPSSEGDLATDYQLALHLASSQEAEPPLSSMTSAGNGSCANSKAAWSQLMAPIQPPKCTVHGELAKEYTVNKPGPNKGKTFFICSRPVGPGYDKGKGDRPREEVDHRYRCNFFMWSANVRREALKKNGASSRP